MNPASSNVSPDNILTVYSSLEGEGSKGGTSMKHPKKIILLLAVLFMAFALLLLPALGA